MGSDDALIGTVVGDKYVIKRLLGEGRMSRVYEGAHRVVETRCVIKVLRSEWAADSAARQYFRNEAKHLARLRHPSLPRIYDFLTVDGVVGSPNLVIVMEKCEGPTLEELLWGGPLSTEEATQIAALVADCLHAAHELCIVHRGLRASEVILSGPSRGGAAVDGERRGEGVRTELTAEMVKVIDWGDSEEFVWQAELASARAADQRSVGKLLERMLMGAVRSGVVSQPLNTTGAWLQEVSSRATSSQEAQQYPSLAALAAVLRAGPPERRPEDEVLLRYCPRCGTQNIDVKSYGSPWTGQCRQCGAAFSLLTLPVGK